VICTRHQLTVTGPDWRFWRWFAVDDPAWC